MGCVREILQVKPCVCVQYLGTYFMHAPPEGFGVTVTVTGTGTGTHPSTVLMVPNTISGRAGRGILEIA